MTMLTSISPCRLMGSASSPVSASLPPSSFSIYFSFHVFVDVTIGRAWLNQLSCSASNSFSLISCARRFCTDLRYVLVKPAGHHRGAGLVPGALAFALAPHPFFVTQHPPWDLHAFQAPVSKTESFSTRWCPYPSDLQFASHTNFSCPHRGVVPVS
jgi:hypothetical protein